MRKLFSIKVILLLALCGTPAARVWAQGDGTKDPEEVVAADEPKTYNYFEREYRKRYYDKNRLDELRNQEEFQYDKIQVRTITNYGRMREISDSEYYRNPARAEEYRQYKQDEDRREGRQNRKSSGKSSSSSSSDAKKNHSASTGGSVNWGTILIIFAALVILIMIALNLKPGSLFRRNRGQDIPIAPAEEQDNIHTMRFETELERAIRLQNYRLALRILYLETLKKLSDSNAIYWRPEKTNWDYVSEMRQHPQHALFAEITRGYDYAWYGEFPIDEATFRLMQEKIITFRNRL